MNIRTTIAGAVIALAALAAPSAHAVDEAGVRALAAHSGLSEQQVRMVLRGRTTMDHRYPRYFDAVEQRLIDAIGKDDYQRLTSGASIVLQARKPDPSPVSVARHDPR
jgi:hypothetical protein